MSKKSTDQTTLFDETPEWQKEWQGMPEFVQEKKKAYAQIIVRFDSEESLQEFAKLIDQKLTRKTKSIWHPAKSHWGGENTKKVYVKS